MIHHYAQINVNPVNRKLLKLFQYFGGDGTWYSTLTSFFLKNIRVVEVFGGSGVITLNYPHVIAYNDLDTRLYAVFSCIKKDPERVIENFLKYYPDFEFEREWMKEHVRKLDAKMHEITDPFELAGIYIARYSLAIKGEKDMWLACSREKFVNPENRVKAIRKAHLKLQKILISNTDFEKVIDLYHDLDVLFYLDPPWYDYENDKWSYIQMQLSDWKRFFNILAKIDNPVVIKHKWHTGFLVRLPKNKDWYVIKVYTKTNTIKTLTKWMIITNYEPKVKSTKQTKNIGLVQYFS